MNRLVCVVQPLSHVVDRVQLLVLDLNQTDRLPRGRLVDSRYTGNQVADVADLVPRHGVLVLGDG